MNKDIFISQCLNYDLVHAMPLITTFLERGFVDNLYIVYLCCEVHFVHVPGFSDDQLNTLCSSNCLCYIHAGSV